MKNDEIEIKTELLKGEIVEEKKRHVISAQLIGVAEIMNRKILLPNNRIIKTGSYPNGLLTQTVIRDRKVVEQGDVGMVYVSPEMENMTEDTKEIWLLIKFTKK